METVLAVENLHKTFRPEVFGRPVQALRGITWEVGAGECVGYLGPNGSGKTTTLKVLTGLMTPSEGSSRMLGHPSTTTRAREGLGYLPENPYFYEHLTPVEALQFYGRLSGLTAAQARERAPSLLERVRLTDASKRRIRGFSKGMRQRFGLAAALIAEPELLLLDEPLTGLDPTGRQLVKQVVLEERRKGRTVFICSHVLADVQELCDRVIVLNEGKVIRDGALHDLLDSEPESFELCAASVPEELVARIERDATLFRRSGGTVTARVAGAKRGPQLAAEVLQAGGSVLSLVPQRETLEQWFVRLTEGDA